MSLKNSLKPGQMTQASEELVVSQARELLAKVKKENVIKQQEGEDFMKVHNIMTGLSVKFSSCNSCGKRWVAQLEEALKIYDEAVESAPEKTYEPYGDEWAKEAMKIKKDDLVEIYYSFVERGESDDWSKITKAQIVGMIREAAQKPAEEA